MNFVLYSTISALKNNQKLYFHTSLARYSSYIVNFLYFVFTIFLVIKKEFRGGRPTICEIFEITKVSSSYHLSVECFSQLSFDSEVYTKSAAVADFVYTSESNESCEKQRCKDDRITSL